MDQGSRIECFKWVVKNFKYNFCSNDVLNVFGDSEPIPSSSDGKKETWVIPLVKPNRENHGRFCCEYKRRKYGGVFFQWLDAKAQKKLEQPLSCFFSLVPLGNATLAHAKV